MATPVLRLGAPAEGALVLPQAAPTPSYLYAPRGVHWDDTVCVVADTGNHRVLIWHGVPTADGAPADVVLGQPDFESEGPNAGGTDRTRGLHLPTGVSVIDGRLVVADAWNHRILVWDAVPQRSFAAPDVILGQPAPDDDAPNQGRNAPTATSLYWPYGFGVVDGTFYVADTGNRRVLGWEGGLPAPGDAPSILLGQDAPTERLENRGVGVGPTTFRWPHAIAGDADRLLVADAGNHRVLMWEPPLGEDRPADGLLGQETFDTAHELPYDAQGPSRLRFPYALDGDGRRLAVADTANNRVLLWNDVAPTARCASADAVLGQPDFDANGENQWTAVADDTLCWPYGLCLHGDRLAIADSGNNRVMVWSLADDPTAPASSPDATAEAPRPHPA